MKKLTALLSLTLLITSLTYAQDKAIDYKTLLSKIPDNINGYSVKGEPNGMNMDMNGMSYSSATKDFENDGNGLNITIVDYKGASNMYMGFTMVWAGDMHMEDESSIANTVEIDGHRGMETYDKEDESSTLLLGVHDRYYVTIAVDGDLDEVKEIAKALKLSSLPK